MRVPFAIVLFVLAGCNTITPNGDLATKFPQAAPITGPVSLDNKQIPLPPGDWVVASGDSHPLTGGRNSETTMLDTLILLNRAPDAKLFAVEITANDSAVTTTAGWLHIKACSRTDMIRNNPDSVSDGDGKLCWFINHGSLTRGPKTSQVRLDALDFFDSRNVRLPLHTVYVGYNIAGRTDYLVVRYFYNPEAEGFAPSAFTSWRGSDWHRDRYRQNAKRKAYIDNLKAWAESWASNVQAGFDGRLAATR